MKSGVLFVTSKPSMRSDEGQVRGALCVAKVLQEVWCLPNARIHKVEKHQGLRELMSVVDELQPVVETGSDPILFTSSECSTAAFCRIRLEMIEKWSHEAWPGYYTTAGS